MLSNVGTPYWWVNEESEAILNRGYLLKGEDIQGAIKRITSAAASRLDKPELQPIFEELVVKGWLSMSSPIWANMGTQRGLPISCFGVNVPDSIEGITSKLGEVIMQTKIGGGTSGSFSELRGRGAAVTDNGNSSGAVSFMRLFDTAMEVVSQGCYTEDTEIYTEKGWMNIKDYVNLQDSTIRLPEWIHDHNMKSMIHDYQQPRAFLKYNNNTIYRFFSEEHKIDVRVTGNHQMILINSNSEITDTVTAQTLFNKYDKFQDCYIITLNEDFTYKKADVKIKDLSVQIIKDTPTNVYCEEVDGIVAVRKDKNHTPILCGNSTRRGSFAAYLDIDHPDIKEFLTIKSVNSSIQNLFYGVCVPDWWLIEMIDGDEQKRELWAKILESRQQKGLPYLFFTDNVNNHKPEIYKKLGRTIVHSNLCSEIALPNNEDESFVCCLSSMNLALYDEWKDTDAVKYAIYFLDAVMSEFVEKTKDRFGLKQSHNFAKNHRALGLGVMGLHTYYQKNMIPFDDPLNVARNTKIFSEIQTKALEASKELAEIYGPAPIFNEIEDENFVKYRNTTVLAIAPTTSSSAILGQVSPGIEPYSSNYYKAGLAKGNFIRKNKYLEELLEEKGLNTEEIWRSIMNHKGSVQHLDFLTEDEKEVFKTFKEINQQSIIDQAAARQRYIDQAQSLNINIPPEISIKEVNRLILSAWKQSIKTLYYQRSQSVNKELLTNIVSCTSCEG